MSQITSVEKRDGTTVLFDRNKIPSVIQKAIDGVKRFKKKVDLNALTDEVIELVLKKKKEVPHVEDIQDAIEEALMNHNMPQVAKAFILYRHERTKLREEKAQLIGGEVADKKLSLNALRVLKERYLLKDNKGNIIETPRDMFERVANNIALADKNYDQDYKKTRQTFFDLLVNNDFLPCSPTLMNAGTPTQQLLASFALPIEDSLESIFTTLKESALIYQTGAGTGFSFSRLRPKREFIAGSQGMSSGPVSFLKIYDKATQIVKEGGKGRGANMGIMRVDHPDILDFISLKERDESIKNFNISVALTEKFMKAVINNTTYSIINPKTGKRRTKYNARSIFDTLTTAAWHNGDPGVVFIDRMNKDNPTPHLGDVTTTSPCGELSLLPGEGAATGSINLGNFITNKNVDWERLQTVIEEAVHFLDNMIDMTKYPNRSIAELTKSNRKIGLGVMGFADLLVQLNIPYNSPDAVNMAEKISSFLRKTADEASANLAKKRGTFPNWKHSMYCKSSEHSKGKEDYKLRNATRLSIAPTGSLSMIADCSPSIEPLFALCYVKRVLGNKEFFYIDKNLQRTLEEAGLYKETLINKLMNEGTLANIKEIPDSLKNVFITAHEVVPAWHVRIQAAFQKSVDNAVSKTVNVPYHSSVNEVKKVYLLAYELGCKGITVYRDNSKAEQVVNILTTGQSTTPEQQKKFKGKNACPSCGQALIIHPTCSYCNDCGYSATHL